MPPFAALEACCSPNMHAHVLPFPSMSMFFPALDRDYLQSSRAQVMFLPLPLLHVVAQILWLEIKYYILFEYMEWSYMSGPPLYITL